MVKIYIRLSPAYWHARPTPNKPHKTYMIKISCDIWRQFKVRDQRQDLFPTNFWIYPRPFLPPRATLALNCLPYTILRSGRILTCGVCSAGTKTSRSFLNQDSQFIQIPNYLRPSSWGGIALDPSLFEPRLLIPPNGLFPIQLPNIFQNWSWVWQFKLLGKYKTNFSLCWARNDHYYHSLTEIYS